MSASTPLPANLKLLNGRSPGKDSAGRPVEKPPPFKRHPPEPPPILTGEALAEWERVTPELARLELTKPVDRGALASYCLAWQRLVDAQKLVDAQGLIVNTTRGPARSPALVTLESASKDVRAWCAEFGFTPSSESRVSRGDDGAADDDNPFA